MPCSWKPGSSRTSSRASTSNSRTTRPFPICKFACARISRASSSRASPAARASSSTARSPAPAALRQAMQVLAAHLPVPHLLARHQAGRSALALVSALPAAQHPPMHRPVQFPRDARRITASRFARCAWCWKARRSGSRARWNRTCTRPARPCCSRRRPGFATTSRPCGSSASAATSTATSAGGLPHRPEEGAASACARCSGWQRRRGPSRASTSPTSAARTRWRRWSASSTACRSSRAIAVTRSRPVQGVDDFASIREVVTRRFRRLSDEDELFPDILLIDGGKGQLNAALEAFAVLRHRTAVPDLAGQARGRDLSARRSRADPPEPALRGPAAAAIRPRRGPPLRPALPPHPAAEEAPGVIIDRVNR